MLCKLCGSDDCTLFASDKHRNYLYCTTCALIFVPASQWVPIEKERKRYQLHHNSADNDDYRNYLCSCIPLLRRIPCQNPVILDFGSGAEAVLTDILNQEGFSCHAYDPLFSVGLSSLQQQYDIVILWEVLEHVRDLNKEIELIRRLMRPEAALLIRTELWRHSSSDAFESWWYTKDCTHINFFSLLTIEIIAQRLGKKIYFCDSLHIIIMGSDLNK